MRDDLLSAAVNSIWAIRRGAIPGILAKLRTELAGTAPPTATPAAEVLAGPYDRLAPQYAAPVAVLRVMGTICHRDSWWGGTSVERFRAQWRAALNDDTVSAILIEVDSGGGTVDGVPEIAAEMFKSKGSRKPVVAISNTFCCSAALWIGAQADELVVVPSSFTGSVGCWTLHENVSKMLEMMGVEITLVFAGDRKVDGNPFEALSEDARADMQRDVDGVNADFVAALARGRGVTTGVVKTTFGEGRVFNAKDAVAIKMADRVATFDEVYAKLAKLKPPAALRSASVAQDAVRGDTDLAVADAGKKKAQPPPCDCDPDCLCQNDGECPENCPTCEPDCPCVTGAVGASVGHVAGDPDADPQRLADLDDLDAAIAIAERR